MENRLVWKDEYLIGVDVIDKEHQRLIKIINKLFAFGEEEKRNQRTCQEGIKFFNAHAMKHFEDEEAYMASIRYEGLKHHRHLHRDFRENTLPALYQELEDSGYSPEAVDHFLGVCAGWLIGHTLTEDQAIVGRGSSKWGQLLPEKELDAMKKVIIQLVFEMFQLESQVVSEAYGGEKFGQGVYYWLSYETAGPEPKRQDVMMVFEERLLVNTVGKALGVKTNKVDSMLIHAARYTARQFVSGVMEHLPQGDSYELKEEKLLTFDQFQQVFDREPPQVSLLFNTGGAGYFAYCAIAPQLLQSTIGGPVENQEAMREVEKYLSRRKELAEEAEAAQRKKILVVDDSATIRLGMKKLLEGDYEVLVVDSGAAAFRSITLEQPDLVLLDYEMPVCDGRQTLEMLRSVKEFENTPVIFLTGRRDRESMINVMPLNPAGYLLKHLKQDEIKAKIDNFMEKGQI